MTDRSIVIVGAGIGGLAAALALTKQGWRVEILDQAHKLEPVGAGVQIGPNATRVLESLGLTERLAPVVGTPESLIVRSGPTGAVLSEMPLGAAAVRRWGSPFQMVHRGDLQMALLAEAETNPNIRITLGRRLESIRELDGGIRASFSKYGEESQIDSQGLIGADGLWSKARNFIGLTSPTSFSGCVAWRTTIPASEAPKWALASRSNLWLGPSAHIVHYPLRGGSIINVVAIVEDSWRERGWSEAGDIAWINRRFRDWHRDVKDLIGAADTWLRWSLFDRPPEWKWTRGPVSLLGDAAHPMLPFIAQGASQALEDAKVLGDCLKESKPLAGALLEYEASRLRRTAMVQKASRQQILPYHANGLIAAGRNLVMRALGGDGLARRYDWLYGKVV
ncbi:MAG: FAD-dependent monooxygenase [Proteobacteria bacterium]|nr:FAD-dependent monooxygenase [Pseudomonadota bacterium]